jgi:hypothetical protein
MDKLHTIILEGECKIAGEDFLIFNTLIKLGIVVIQNEIWYSTKITPHLTDLGRSCTVARNIDAQPLHIPIE